MQPIPVPWRALRPLREFSLGNEKRGASPQNHVDMTDNVIQVCITMKTATVRDLRNRFADVAKWIEGGEQVAITRNGAAFATLAPAKPAKRVKVDWALRFAKRKPLGRKLTTAETDAFWSSLRD